MTWVALRRTDWVMETFHLGQTGKTEDFLEKDPGEVQSKGLQTSDVLFIVLIGVGFLLLIPAAADLLEKLYYGFAEKVGRDHIEPTAADIFIPLVKVLIPLFVVLFAKRLSLKLTT